MLYHKLNNLCLIALFACCLILALVSETHAHGINVPATKITGDRNQAVADRLPLALEHDFEFAQRGLIAQLPEGKIFSDDGRLVVDASSYDFVEGDAPAEVNPSLWRHAKLSRLHGLFKIKEGVYEFRGYDLAVMTLIAGESGWIIVDPLFTADSSRAGLKLANETLGERKVSTVIITHSHQDHFGGINGVLPTEEDARAEVAIIAPHNYYSETLTEHLLAGPHMYNRIKYPSGMTVAVGPQGRMGLGLAQVAAQGPVESLPATEELPIGDTPKVVDGVEFIFHDASGTEATSELMFYLPEHKVLHTAEVVSGTMHNILTPRGAQVRDALLWSQVIDELIAAYGHEVETLIASHHHPFYGNEAVNDKLRNHRNLYRYIHDQTVRLANNGKTMHEIANELPEPKLMQGDFSVRPYYGNFRHNIRAVFQRYFGWWSGIPSRLDPLSPEDEAKHFVEAVGGERSLLKKAQKAFDNGDYRWAATMLGHGVFANPNNQKIRNLLGKTFRQLAYVNESAIFRNVYITASEDMFQGPKVFNYGVDHAHGLPLNHFGDFLAVRYNPQKYTGKPFIVEFELTDIGQVLSLDVDEDVLFPRVGQTKDADYRFKTTYSRLEDWVNGKMPTEDFHEIDSVSTELSSLLNALDIFTVGHNVSEP